MSDYISRQDAVEASWQILNGLGYSEKHNDRLVEEVDAVFDEIPAADVRPVVRGKWERMSDNDVFGDINCNCSACGEDWWQGPGWFRNARFCPNCGAWMEES